MTTALADLNAALAKTQADLDAARDAYDAARTCICCRASLDERGDCNPQSYPCGHTMTRAILVRRPIPLLANPNMRWVAVYEHFVPGEPIGYGATKAGAEADLRALTPCTRELEERA